MKIQPCKECGAAGLMVKYREVAYQFVDASGEQREDGYNIQEHSLDLDDVYCVGCNKKRTLTKQEQGTVRA